MALSAPQPAAPGQSSWNLNLRQQTQPRSWQPLLRKKHRPPHSRLKPHPRLSKRSPVRWLLLKLKDSTRTKQEIGVTAPLRLATFNPLYARAFREGQTRTAQEGE